MSPRRRANGVGRAKEASRAATAFCFLRGWRARETRRRPHSPRWAARPHGRRDQYDDVLTLVILRMGVYVGGNPSQDRWDRRREQKGEGENAEGQGEGQRVRG